MRHKTAQCDTLVEIVLIGSSALISPTHHPNNDMWISIYINYIIFISTRSQHKIGK